MKNGKFTMVNGKWFVLFTNLLLILYNPPV